MIPNLVQNNISEEPLTILIDTSLGTGLTYTLPKTNSGVYDYTVDWGDGYTRGVVGYSIESHTYSTDGVYTVTVTGTFSQISFDSLTQSQLMTTSLDCGSVVCYALNSSFLNCINITSILGISTGDTSLRNCFLNTNSLIELTINDTSLTTNWWSAFENSSINNTLDLDFSVANDLRECFKGSSFNNVSCEAWNFNNNEVSLYETFYNDTNFNRDISGWNIRPTIMPNTFRNTSFNQDISNWDMSSCTNLSTTFFQTPFNQNLGAWNIDNVTTMVNLFRDSGMNDVNTQLTIEGWYNWDGIQVTNPVQNNVTIRFNNNTVSGNASLILSWLVSNKGYILQNITY